MASAAAREPRGCRGERPPGALAELESLEREGVGDVRVYLLCGPTGVGKSTVGWQVYERIRASGVTAAYVDLDQLGFCPPGDTG